MKKNKKQDVYTAYHEAGHAVVGWDLFNLKRIKMLTIVPEPKNNTLGRVKTKRIMQSIDYDIGDSPAFEGKIMREIMELFAGYVAEKKIRKRGNSVGAWGDFNNILDLTTRLYGGYDTEVQKHFQDYLLRRTELIIDQKWNLVKAVAKELLEKKTLSKDDFWKIIDRETIKEMNKFKNKLNKSRK